MIKYLVPIIIGNAIIGLVDPKKPIIMVFVLTIQKDLYSYFRNHSKIFDKVN